jgi:hypothetical protein
LVFDADWVPRISTLHAHQKWKLDLLSHTSLPRGTVSINGRAITSGNQNSQRAGHRLLSELRLDVVRAGEMQASITA